MTSGVDTSSSAADPIPDAVYNRVLMAAMAGRRTMVVSDHTGGNGAVIGRRMAEYMSSSGGMALTATGYRNATLEDLLSEAAAGLGLKRSDDLEELALSLERALDAAGSGLLVVFDAHLLSAPVIGDLFELSGSNTDSGLYMQILLTGGPGLDAQFDKPGLANAARQVASSRWRIENEAPVEEEQPAPPPPAPRPMAAAARREPAPAPMPQPAFIRRRVQRREEVPVVEPAFEPPPLRTAPRARAYAIQPDARLKSRQPARSSRRVYWVLALGILFAFAAGFVTNALWPFAPKSATELLKGDGLSALTANLPSTPPRPVPVEPQVQPEPDPAPSARAPAAAAPPPAPATQPTPRAAPPAVALPPEWNQPVERSRPSNTRSAPVAAPPAERPVAAAPTPPTPQAQQVRVTACLTAGGAATRESGVTDGCLPSGGRRRQSRRRIHSPASPKAS